MAVDGMPSPREIIEAIEKIKHIVEIIEDLKRRMAQSEITAFEVDQIEKNVKVLQDIVKGLDEKAREQENSENKRKGMILLVTIAGGIVGWVVAFADKVASFFKIASGH